MKKLIFITIIISFSIRAIADINTDLDNFFNGVGFSSNTTKPQSYESQASGLYGGGSLYLRAPVRRYELITLDMPDYRAGCAGIDLFTGSLSYISGEKLTNLGKQIMTNGGAYAVDVMLATTVPELKQVRDFLQTTVQKVNQSSINSCEMAQNLVGGIWPKTIASQQKICNDQRRMGQEGWSHDYVDARMACANNDFQETMEYAAKNPERAKQVVMNKNLVWEILQSSSFTKDNQELSELMLSLTGTIIIDKNGKVRDVPPLIDNSELINTLLGTSAQKSAEIWRCDEGVKCLNPHLTYITIAESRSLSGRIKNIIHAIDEKLKSDTRLSSTETNFLEMTSIPVLKFLLVLNSAQYGNAAVEINGYSTLIASDLLQQYLSGLLKEISIATTASPLGDDLLKALRGRIELASTKVLSIEPQVSRKLTEKLALIQNVMQVEKQLSANFNI
ncbi:MAG: conjugal transfer protein TraH [Legionellaceae bacterium]|nr:conjugal transfer protein TraH [Legionellaceae bacterium]